MIDVAYFGRSDSSGLKIEAAVEVQGDSKDPKFGQKVIRHVSALFLLFGPQCIVVQFFCVLQNQYFPKRTVSSTIRLS